MLHPRSTLPPLIGLGIVVALSSGCSRSPQVTALPQGEQNLRAIFKAYTQAAMKLGHSPKDAEELKPFLKDYGNPDELLISPNDGKPYAIVPGVNLNKPQAGAVVAYEQDGKDGKRQYIGLSSSAVQTATEEEFARLSIPRQK